MVSICPTCGGPVKVSAGDGADDLLDILTKDSSRFIYRGRNGGWWLTKNRGELNADVIRDLIRRGVIRSCYSDCPDEAYHVGRTIDVTRTMEARRKFGKGVQHIYTDTPTDTGSVT